MHPGTSVCEVRGPIWGMFGIQRNVGEVIAQNCMLYELLQMLEPETVSLLTATRRAMFESIVCVAERFCRVGSRQENVWGEERGPAGEMCSVYGVPCGLIIMALSSSLPE